VGAGGGGEVGGILPLPQSNPRLVSITTFFYYYNTEEIINVPLRLKTSWHSVLFSLEQSICRQVSKCRYLKNKTEKSFSNLAATQFCFSRSNKSTTTLQFFFCKVA
jgi:hypothetical protein